MEQKFMKDRGQGTIGGRESSRCLNEGARAFSPRVLSLRTAAECRKEGCKPANGETLAPCERQIGSSKSEATAESVR